MSTFHAYVRGAPQSSSANKHASETTNRLPAAKVEAHGVTAKSFGVLSSTVASLATAALALTFTTRADAQTCHTAPNGACSHPGLACTDSGVSGVCKTAPLSTHAFECTCEGPTFQPPPPVVMNLKYVIGALIYAPPGCNGNSAGTACSQPGLVDYSSGSSMGSKYSTANSFKNGVKVTLNTGTSVSGTESSFAWNRTTSDTSTVSLTKSSSLEIKVPANGDGIDHDQDMFILLLNPTVTLSMDSNQNIYWQPGFSGDGPERLEVYVGELRNPSTMRPAVAGVLKGLGFTAADYKTIRCQDPFSGPGSTGTGAIVRPDFCLSNVLSLGAPNTLDPNRFRSTTYTLPYEPPVHAGDNCPSITLTLKNDYTSEDARSSQDEYSVSVEGHTGVEGAFGLKLEGSMTWTSSETDTTNQASSQSASFTLVCPSIGYSGPIEFNVYVDALYGTFLFVPFDPVTMTVVQHGTVSDRRGKPIPGVPVTLDVGGRTHHTFTSGRGTYRFIGLKGLAAPALQTGTLSIGNRKQQVPLRSPHASAIRLD